MATSFISIAGLVVLSFAFLEASQVTRDEFESLQNDLKDLSQDMRNLISMINTDSNRNNREKDIGEKVINDHFSEPGVANGTLEERVTLLELQVDDITSDLGSMEDDITIISTEQILQDQKILELEIESNGFEDSIESLIATDVSVNLELESMNLELGSVNVTLIDHDNRLERQEVSGAVAFQVEIGEYVSIPEDSVVIFNQVDLNFGGGFNEETGEFTVPPGGAGLYFFHVNLLMDIQERADFLMRMNGAQVCRAIGEMDNSGVQDKASSSRALVITLNEGDLVDVYYTFGTDDTPVWSSTNHDNTFTGFRIAPE